MTIEIHTNIAANEENKEKASELLFALAKNYQGLYLHVEKDNYVLIIDNPEHENIKQEDITTLLTSVHPEIQVEFALKAFLPWRIRPISFTQMLTDLVAEQVAQLNNPQSKFIDDMVQERLVAIKQRYADYFKNLEKAERAKLAKKAKKLKSAKRGSKREDSDEEAMSIFDYADSQIGITNRIDLANAESELESELRSTREWLATKENLEREKTLLSAFRFLQDFQQGKVAREDYKKIWLQQYMVANNDPQVARSTIEAKDEDTVVINFIQRSKFNYKYATEKNFEVDRELLTKKIAQENFGETSTTILAGAWYQSFSLTLHGVNIPTITYYFFENRINKALFLSGISECYGLSSITYTTPVMKNSIEQQVAQLHITKTPEPAIAADLRAALDSSIKSHRYWSKEAALAYKELSAAYLANNQLDVAYFFVTEAKTIATNIEANDLKSGINQLTKDIIKLAKQQGIQLKEPQKSDNPEQLVERAYHFCINNGFEEYRKLIVDQPTDVCQAIETRLQNRGIIFQEEKKLQQRLQPQ